MQASVTRRGVLRRLGAGIVGVSAAGVLADRRAKVAEASPACCRGGICPPGPCRPAIPECCWYCQQGNRCTTYRCCDRDCNYDRFARWDCTVAIFVGHAC